MASPLELRYRALAGAVTVTEANAAARTYAEAEKAGATRRAYRADFAIFADWCHVDRKSTV